MHYIRLDVPQNPCVVSDEENSRVILILEPIDALAHNFERINIKTRVRFIKDRNLWLHQPHLQNLVALLFTAREAFVYVATGERRIHL